MMEEDAKRRLKAAELQAKKTRLKIWTNYVPPATNSKAIHDQNFTGKVIMSPKQCLSQFIYSPCQKFILNCIWLFPGGGGCKWGLRYCS